MTSDKNSKGGYTLANVLIALLYGAALIGLFLFFINRPRAIAEIQREKFTEMSEQLGGYSIEQKRFVEKHGVRRIPFMETTRNTADEARLLSSAAHVLLADHIGRQELLEGRVDELEEEIEKLRADAAKP